jgi:outer membrane protein insertion porin family
MPICSTVLRFRRPDACFRPAEASFCTHDDPGSGPRPLGGQLLVAFLLAALLAGVGAAPAGAQAPLIYVDDETEVRGLSFRFIDSQTFSTDRLQGQIATAAPSLLDRVQSTASVLPFVTAPRHPFDPVTLQKDVVRLRRFYAQNGFLKTEIDYPASQLDTTSNSIRVIFSIREGPPVRVRDVAFLGPDSASAATQFNGASLQAAWTDFREQLPITEGQRYTDFNRVRTEDQVLNWVRDQGFAFADVSSTTTIDSTANTARVRFVVDAGPRGRFADVDIEGNASVERSVLLREVPFQPGDRYSASKLQQGQRELFGLNLFRVVLADVPEQPRDSTVAVRLRVREASLHYLSGQVGYGANTGVSLEGQWTHRNFFGSARNFTANLLAETGFFSNSQVLPAFLRNDRDLGVDRRFRASVSLKQPYFFNASLSASVEPFLEYRSNSNLSTPPDAFLGLNERNLGLNTTLIYEFIPFRTLTLQHTFTRSLQLTSQISEGTQTTEDFFNRSVFSASATLGRADDYLSPSRGFLIRPFAELGGSVFASGVEYAKVGAEVTGYLPLAERIDLAGRLFAGRIWPFSESRTLLRRRNLRYENRFDDIFFYAGGGSDLRGWSSQLAGAKFPREREGTRTGTSPLIFEPVGGTEKIGANLELRLPFPALSSDWRTALFVDAGRVQAGAFLPDTSSFAVLPDGSGSPAEKRSTIGALLDFSPRVSVGTGLRYSTPFGLLRVDLAYKLTPGPFDLRTPQAVATSPGAASPSPIRRLKLHFGIGRAF